MSLRAGQRNDRRRFWSLPRLYCAQQNPFIGKTRRYLSV
jgi:hypothetical protein